MYDKKFSGHQSFPLRKGWLHKYYMIEKDGITGPDNKKIDDVSKITVEDLSVVWGVGKNMVDAVKYWANAVGIGNSEKSKQSDVSQEQALRSKDVYRTIDLKDPYIAKRATLWLVHWLLCRDTSTITSYRYFFGFYNGLTVSRDTLYSSMLESFEQRNLFQSALKKDSSTNYLSLDAPASMKKDIGVFFQMYSPKTNSKKKDIEDNMLAMFTELELLKELGGQKDIWVCELDERLSLSQSVFNFCLFDYILRSYANSTSETIPLDDLIYNEGSPGRVFRMSGKEIENRLELMKKREMFRDKMSFDNSRGSRGIVIQDKTLFSLETANKLLDEVYS